MLENKNLSKTKISSLGEFALIDHLTKTFELNQKSSVLGIGDDAAILDLSQGKTVVSTDLLIEGCILI